MHYHFVSMCECFVLLPCWWEILPFLSFGWPQSFWLVILQLLGEQKQAKKKISSKFNWKCTTSTTRVNSTSLCTNYWHIVFTSSTAWLLQYRPFLEWKQVEAVWRSNKQKLHPSLNFHFCLVAGLIIRLLMIFFRAEWDLRWFQLWKRSLLSEFHFTLWYYVCFWETDFCFSC